MLSGEKYIDHHTECIDIRGTVCLRETILFGRCVAQCAQDACIAGTCFLRGCLTYRIEINQHTSVTVDNDILRLDITVNQVF